MGGLHAPLDALFEIDARRKLKPKEIERIDIEVSHAVYHHGWWQLERPITPIAAQMNMAYAIAVAIIDGAAMVHQFSPQRIDQDDVWRLIPKVTAHHNPEFDNAGQLGRGRTRMCVRFTDGTTMESFRQASRAILSPLSNEEILAKFRVLTDGIVDTARREAIEQAVLHMEELPSASRLTELLAPAVGAAFDSE